VLATFATLGIAEVEFKADGKSHTLKPHQVPFATFIVTVPMWRALPPAVLPAYTQVQLPSGDTINAQSFADRVKEGEPVIVKHLLNELETGMMESQQGLLERLPGLKIEGWDKIAIKLLEKGSRTSQLAVIKAAATTGNKEIYAALAVVVEKSPDAELRTAAAEALTKSGDPRYASMGAVSAMKGGDSAAALKAIDEIVAKRSPGAAAELVKALSGDEAVARRAAIGLGELGATAELLAALKNEALPLPIREHVAAEVGRLPTKPDAFLGLSFLAAQGSPARALPAIDSLTKYTDPEPAPALEKGLKNPSSRVRIHAANALATIKEVDSIKAMSNAASANPDDTTAIEAAMVTLLSTAERVDDLKDRLKKTGADTQLKRATYHALGVRAQKDGFFKRIHEDLLEGLKATDATVRGGAILGLSVAAADDDLLSISALSGDASARTRQDVALALGNYPAGKATDALKKLVADSDPQVLIAAASSLGKRKEADLLRDLVKQQRNENPAVRAALIVAIAQMFTPDNKVDVLSAISKGLTDTDKMVKLTAIEVLGAFNEGAALDALALVSADADPDIQQVAFVSLGQTKSKRAVDLLAQALKSENVENRRVALKAMQTHGDKACAPKIEAALTTETDPEIKALAAEVLATLK
jgi:HEAT repeat protein